MSEEMLVRNCAPTLAGIKTASLFTCACRDRDATLEDIRAINRRLWGKGLRLIPLRFSQEKVLLYLYRPSLLQADISDSRAAALLAQRGYDPASCGRCLSRLRHRLDQEPEFPHEIGLFLGYPPEDVAGFIDNKAQGCKCVGCWKVYGDEAAARKKFALYKKCTRVYQDRWTKGTDIERLTVAG